MLKQWSEERRIQPSPFDMGTEYGEIWTSSKICNKILLQSLQHFRNVGEAVDSSRLAMLLLQRREGSRFLSFVVECDRVMQILVIK
ncbi:MAG: hypothetical protein WD469_09920 [Paenibacillaceae bacterium]